MVLNECKVTLLDRKVSIINNFDFSTIVSWLLEKAKELASKVDGEAITLVKLEYFHPEEGMILANTTSIDMKPRINDTLYLRYVSSLHPFLIFILWHLVEMK